MRDIVDYFVLDTLADDVESLDQIIPGVRRCVELWQVDDPIEHFDRSRIIASLLRLITEEKVAVLRYDNSEKALLDAGIRVIPDGSFDDYWFRMTSSGRIVHQSWEPPPERLSVQEANRHAALIQWSDAQKEDGLPDAGEIVRPAWFEGETENGQGWSLKCRFDVHPAAAGNPTPASIQFIAEGAPHDRLVRGAVLLMHEPGKRDFARVSVVA